MAKHRWIDLAAWGHSEEQMCNGNKKNLKFNYFVNTLKANAQ